MNGQTNVQIAALATFVSVTLLWLAGFFFPDLMATAPEMLGELFTGALIVVAGLVFKSDAGFKALPGTGNDNGKTNLHPLAFLLTILITLSVLSSCVGTRAAYKAADGIDETAFVMTKHWEFLLVEADRLAANGVLSGSALASAQNIAREGTPFIKELKDARDTFIAVKSSSNEIELQRALNLAVTYIAKLTRMVKSGSGPSGMRMPTERPPSMLVLTPADLLST